MKKQSGFIKKKYIIKLRRNRLLSITTRALPANPVVFIFFTKTPHPRTRRPLYKQFSLSKLHSPRQYLIILSEDSDSSVIVADRRHPSFLALHFFCKFFLFFTDLSVFLNPINSIIVYLCNNNFHSPFFCFY